MNNIARAEAGEIFSAARQYERAQTVDNTAREFAELRVLGDVLEFSESVDLRDGLSNEADRALRVPSRLQEADSGVVLAALLLAAHRGDSDDVMRAAQLLTSRFLANQAQRIDRIAGGDE